MHHSVMLDAPITARLQNKARAIGFDLCGVARADTHNESDRLPEWLARGYAGEMQYMHDVRRRSVHDTMPEARSVIVCAMNYNAALPYSTAVAANHDGNAAAENTDGVPRAWISRYAWGDDYHYVLKPKLDELVAWLRSEFGKNFQSRTYVDTGPVLERVAAHQAGLGWLAKNTCLINQHVGSWLFLGVILTDLDLAPTLADDHAPPRDLCGSCTRCIDACPTAALVAPYVLDARRCISYLTIELRGTIPDEFRAAMGSMVFGCDICQDVCPWNRKSPKTAIAAFLPRSIVSGDVDQAGEPASAPEDVSLFSPPLEWLVSLTEEEFRCAFRGSPVKRTKYHGLLRNTCVALGNSNISPENPTYPRILHRLGELARGEDPVLADHALWALTRLRAREKEPARANQPHNFAQSENPIPVARHIKLTDHAEGE